MADINPEASEKPARDGVEPRSATTGPGEKPGADPRLITLVELFFFAYRDFTGDADSVLEKFGFGRAHHRVLHFVCRNPGIRVADLLDILKITKQSLARVLKQLVDQGYIEQRSGVADRRERRLHATRRGTALARELMALQTARIAASLQDTGAASQASAERFLYGMIAPQEREKVLDLLRGAVSDRDMMT